MAFVFIIVTLITTLSAWTFAPQFQKDGMLYPYQVWHQKKWYQLFSSSFLHADLTHLAFNMLTLYFFGPYLESILGSGLFAALYMSAAIVSSLPTLYKHKDNPNYASLGASGAVEAVIFSYILFEPLSKIYLFFIPVGIPALIFGFLYIGYSFYASNRGTGNINHDAHIGGALFGLIFTLISYPDSLSIFLSYFGY
ncbi:rhomboid family intramembrane serine protease [bacterium]|nr:MAG: rhomboid family intramembrane serine protease [bacterium]